MVKSAYKGVKFNDDGLDRKVDNGKFHEFRNIRQHKLDKQVTRVKLSQGLY